MSEKLSPAQLLAKQLNSAESEETILLCQAKAMREVLGLSQSDVGRAIGCSTATVGSIERGSPPRLDVAMRLAAWHEVPISAIWTLPEAKEHAHKATPPAPK